MEKSLLQTMLLAFVLAFPIPTLAEVNVSVNIPLPPLIVFASPPEVVVIPETYVYVVPDSHDDIYFYNGWWWRPWEGRWYRSRNYNSGWVYYERVPSFYRRVPSGWREDYRDHRWGGQPWNYQRIPHQQLKQNWSGWQKDNHWEKQQTWGVQGLKRRTQSKPQEKPQSRETSKPQQSRPQSHEASRPQQSRPQSHEASKPQQSRPQSGEVQQRSQPQQREAPKQSKPQQGKPGRGDEGNQDRKQEERR